MPEREPIIAWYFDENGIPVAMGRFGTVKPITLLPPPDPVDPIYEGLDKVTIPLEFDLAKGDSQPVVTRADADLYYTDVVDDDGSVKTFIIMKGTIDARPRSACSAGSGDAAVGYRIWTPSYLWPSDPDAPITGHAHLWIDGSAGYTGTVKWTARHGTNPHLIFQFGNGEWEIRKPESWSGQDMHCTFTLIYERNADA